MRLLSTTKVPVKRMLKYYRVSYYPKASPGISTAAGAFTGCIREMNTADVATVSGMAGHMQSMVPIAAP